MTIEMIEMRATPGNWRPLCREVEKLVASELQRRFGDRFVFDPIRASLHFDRDDEPYLRVSIVFDGDAEKERVRELAKGALGLMLPVEDKLHQTAAGTDAEDLLLVPSYIARSEWDELAEATA